MVLISGCGVGDVRCVFSRRYLRFRRYTVVEGGVEEASD